MPADLTDLIAYAVDRHAATSRYPLTNARLTKLVYLADWGACLAGGRPLTQINWVFNHHGPWVPDVILAVEDHPELFEMKSGHRRDGGSYRTIGLAPGAQPGIPDADERFVLDKAVAMSADKPFDEFVDAIYQTYPVRTSERYQALDLRALARSYREEAANRPLQVVGDYLAVAQ